ncbi:MAG: hypothetical protein QM692_08500 [Thermomicrobiales bacterium]
MTSRRIALCLVTMLPLAVVARPLAPGGQAGAAQARGSVAVDNSGAQGAVTGRVIDDSAWPVVVVALRNDHSFWVRSSIWSTLGDVSIEEMDTRTNTWARWGYIPPGSEAVYVLRFVPTGISSIQFYANAGQTEDGAMPAGVITVAERTIDTFLTWVGAKMRFQDASLQTMVDAVDQFTQIPGCVDALESALRQNAIDIPELSEGFITCLTGEKQMAALALILSQFGKEVSRETLKNLITSPLKLIDLTWQVGDTFVAVLNNSWAGSVVFTGQGPRG